MTPRELRAFHCGPLTGRLAQLGAIHALQVAECAHDHGFIDTANALEVDVSELTACMVANGYDQCQICEEWKETAELGPLEIVGEAEPAPLACEDCRG